MNFAAGYRGRFSLLKMRAEEFSGCTVKFELATFIETIYGFTE